MKKIVIVLAVLLALVAMPAAPAYADAPQSVGNFQAYLSGADDFQAEVHFVLTKCGTGLMYKVVLENVPAGVKPVVHLIVKKDGGYYQIGLLDREVESINNVWFKLNHYSFDGMLITTNAFYLTPTLEVPAGLTDEELFITEQRDANGEIHFRQLQPLVDNFLIAGDAYVKIQLPGQEPLISKVSGQSNGVWPALPEFYLG